MVKIIAECGINYVGSMWIAKRMIREAKACGATTAKFQLYDTDKLFKPNFKWYDYCKNSELSFEQVLMLQDECDKAGIQFMASIFNADRVEWAKEIGMEQYKLASQSIFDKELIRAIEKTGRDIYVSLGHWKKKQFPKFNTTGKVYYLYCISKYPTPIDEVHLEKVDFKKYVGFSDHTIGIESAKKAIDFGAQVIEKHFTLDKHMFGPDQMGSMEPSELKELVDYANATND